MENQSKDPILVVNPYNAKYVNIRPLFDFLNEYAQDNPAQISAEMASEARFLTMSFNPTDGFEWKEFQSVLFKLYNIHDMFEALTSFKEQK